MKKVVYVVVVVAIVFGVYSLFGKPASTSKPLIADVQPMLEDYLLAKNKEKCRGEIKVEYINSVEVGEYDSALMGGKEGGWPVYAEYEITCKEGSVVTSDKDLNDSTDKVAVTFMRRTRAGKVEFFQPKVVADFENMLKSSF